MKFPELRYMKRTFVCGRTGIFGKESSKDLTIIVIQYYKINDADENLIMNLRLIS